MPAVYTTEIPHGYTALNDWCLEFTAARVIAPYCDVGCNSGALLLMVPGGVGVDRSEPMITACRARGLNVVHADAQVGTPFPPKAFRTVVLGSVLEQCDEPARVWAEAVRIGERIIGLSPIPGGPWGVAGVGWVRSVLSRQWFEERGCAVEEYRERGKLYFERPNTESGAGLATSS